MAKITSIYNILFTFIFLCFIFTDTGCKKENASTVVIMNVGSKLVKGGPAPPASADNPTVIYYMSITDEGSTQVYGLALGRIEGFEYVEGYSYKIKVLKTHINNPPADGYIESYKLIEIIAKEKVQNSG